MPHRNYIDTGHGRITKGEHIMKKLIKKSAAALALGLSLSLFAGLPAFASTVEQRNVSSTTTGTTKNIKIKEVSVDLYDDDYDWKNVEVEFTYDVRWQRDASVSVKDENGTAYSADLVDWDEDDCDIYVENLTDGHTYTFTISGIRRTNTSTYGSVSFSVEVPKESNTVSSDVSVAVKEAEYDWDDRELSIEFRRDVVFKKDATITVTDSSGNTYSARFLEKDDDECEIRVTGLEYGETYNYTITGIRNASGDTYGYASGSFRAIDD